MEGNEVQSSVAVIDNGSFGKRKIKFETGRLARQAAGTASQDADGLAEDAGRHATGATAKPE